MWKAAIGIAVFAATIGTPVLAADMPIKAPPAPPRATAVWTGCYLGLSVGESFASTGGFSTTSGSQSPVTTTAMTAINLIEPISNGFHPSGPIGGALAGCNYQLGAWVAGIEGDWSATDQKGQAPNTPFSVLNNPPIFSLLGGTVPALPNTVSYSLDERWLTTARVRLGYATGNWLFYGTGGAAWAKIVSTQTLTGGPGFAQSDTRAGWTLGAGLEYCVNSAWLMRAEYLYVDIDRWTTFNSATPPFTNFQAPLTNLAIHLRQNIVRLGVAYKFN